MKEIAAAGRDVILLLSAALALWMAISNYARSGPAEMTAADPGASAIAEE